MESNHASLGVDQASLPLDHGAVLLKWSHRESHPDFRLAEPASSCWTMTPKRKPDHRCAAVPTRTHKRLLAATCFQDRFLIRPDDFRL